MKLLVKLIPFINGSVEEKIPFCHDIPFEVEYLGDNLSENALLETEPPRGPKSWSTHGSENLRFVSHCSLWVRVDLERWLWTEEGPNTSRPKGG